jgi:carbon storage regulator CsrA
MLVLARHVGQWIDVEGGSKAGGVSICLVSIIGNIARIGIECPRDKPILRRELEVRIEDKEAKE